VKRIGGEAGNESNTSAKQCGKKRAPLDGGSKTKLITLTFERAKASQRLAQKTEREERGGGKADQQVR